jgi:hypothetical protein
MDKPNVVAGRNVGVVWQGSRLGRHGTDTLSQIAVVSFCENMPLIQWLHVII